jgi:tetratricopeptide (TPR) repeat protein
MQSFTRGDQSAHDQIEEGVKLLSLQSAFNLIEEGDKLCEEYLNGNSENLAEAFNKYESAIATINNINNVDENPRTILDLYYEIDQHCPFKPTASNFATSLNNIGTTYYKVNLDEALKYFEYAMEIKVIKENEPNSFDVAIFSDNIGAVYKSQGKLDEALHFFTRSLKIKRQYPEHPNYIPNLAIALKRVGVIYYSQGKFEEALKSYKEVCDIRKKLAPNSLDVAAILDNIGSVYKSQGKLDEALKNYQEAYGIIKELAPNSLDVAIVSDNMGGVYYSQGKLDEALEYFKASLEIKQQHEANILNVAISLNSIGVVYHSQDKFEEALESYQKAYDIRKEHAPNSLSAFTVSDNIGAVYQSQAKFEDALNSYQEALEIMEQLAPNSLDVAAVLDNIGEVYESQGKLDEALKYYKKALDIKMLINPDSEDVSASSQKILEVNTKVNGQNNSSEISLIIGSESVDNSVLGGLNVFGNSVQDSQEGEDVEISPSPIKPLIQNQEEPSSSNQSNYKVNIEEALNYHREALNIMEELALDILDKNNGGGVYGSQDRLKDVLDKIFNRDLISADPYLINSSYEIANHALKLAEKGDNTNYYLGIALKCSDILIKKDPGYKFAYLIKGLALQKQGQLNKGLEVLSSALRIDPSYGEAKLTHIEISTQIFENEVKQDDVAYFKNIAKFIEMIEGAKQLKLSTSNYTAYDLHYIASRSAELFLKNIKDVNIRLPESKFQVGDPRYNDALKRILEKLEDLNPQKKDTPTSKASRSCVYPLKKIVAKCTVM